MKKLIILFFMMTLVLPISSASATPVSISFGGYFAISDTGGASMLDEVSFTSGSIGIVTPSDSMFSGASLSIASLKLSEAGYVPGSFFLFDPTKYTDGFTITSSDGHILLQADLTVTKLEIVSSTGLINSAFTMNLTDITSFYSLGTSSVIDAFLNAPGGAANITLQITGDLSSAIINASDETSSIAGSYSGSAAPVPEPATVLLIGSALAGLGLIRIRRK